MTDLSSIFISQYSAALQMLRKAVEQCPAALWNHPDDPAKFWHIAYHALFYTHLYLQESGQTFVPWVKHQPESEFMGQLPWPPHALPRVSEPYDQATVLEFVEYCLQEVRTRVPVTVWEAASGFDWLPFSKLELQIYTIRHLQQHTGELMERLGTRAQVELAWVGSQPQ